MAAIYIVQCSLAFLSLPLDGTLTSFLCILSIFIHHVPGGLSSIINKQTEATEIWVRQILHTLFALVSESQENTYSNPHCGDKVSEVHTARKGERKIYNCWGSANTTYPLSMKASFPFLMWKGLLWSSCRCCTKAIILCNLKWCLY